MQDFFNALGNTCNWLNAAMKVDLVIVFLFANYTAQAITKKIRVVLMPP